MKSWPYEDQQDSCEQLHLHEQWEAVLCSIAHTSVSSPLQKPEALQRNGRKTRKEKVGGNHWDEWWILWGVGEKSDKEVGNQLWSLEWGKERVAGPPSALPLSLLCAFHWGSTDPQMLWSLGELSLQCRKTWGTLKTPKGEDRISQDNESVLSAAKEETQFE